MNDPAKTLEEAARAAHKARVLAVKAAREDLNTAIRAAYSEAVERAWSQYDTRLTEIWQAYDAAVARINDCEAGVEAREDESFIAALASVPPIPETGAPVIVAAKDYRSAAIIL